MNHVNPVEPVFFLLESIPGATLLAASASVKIAERRVRRERSLGSPDRSMGVGFVFLVRF